MLLPALYQQTIGSPCYKKYSFSRSAPDFDAETWRVMEEGTAIRTAWRYRPFLRSAGEVPAAAPPRNELRGDSDAEGPAGQAVDSEAAPPQAKSRGGSDAERPALPVLPNPVAPPGERSVAGEAPPVRPRFVGDAMRSASRTLLGSPEVARRLASNPASTVVRDAARIAGPDLVARAAALADAMWLRIDQTDRELPAARSRIDPTGTDGPAMRSQVERAGPEKPAARSRIEQNGRGETVQ